MTDIVLRDIDPVLAGRIRKLAEQRGWDMHHALLELIEHGLLHFESHRIARFSGSEDVAFREMMVALEQVPDNPGFGLIGRNLPQSGEPATPSREPDQDAE
jgi:hypothetical protein